MIGRTAIFKVSTCEGAFVELISLVAGPAMQAGSSKTRPSKMIEIRLFIAEVTLSFWFNTLQL
jgi:hypothetical protein